MINQYMQYLLLNSRFKTNFIENNKYSEICLFFYKKEIKSN